MSAVNRQNGIGRLVCVEDYDGMYGRTLFTTKWNNETLVAIDIIGDYLTKNKDIIKDIKLYKNNVDDLSVIITKEKYVRQFIEPIKYIRRSKIIDIGSIKTKEHCEASLVKKDDIVKYDNDDRSGICHGRIVEYVLLNDVRCVGVVDCIEIPGRYDVVYVRECDMTVVIVDGSMTKYIEDAIVDPLSIVTLKLWSVEDFGESDDIEFTLKDSQRKCCGNIRLIIEVNNEICAIVEFSGSHIQDNIERYKINDNPKLRGICNFTNVACIVRGPPTIRRKYLICDVTNMAILNPGNVDLVAELQNKVEVITFKSNEVDIVAKLLWYGSIFDEIFIGCELKQETIYGTNGTFGEKKLFECRDSKGVLFPLAKIAKCCVNGDHRQLLQLNDGRIIGSSICCARGTRQSNFNVGDKICNMKGIHGTCCWMGLVNNVEVIGVNTEQDRQDWLDDSIDKLELFNSLSNKIGLFKSSELALDESSFFSKEIFFKEELDLTAVVRRTDGILLSVKGYEGIHGRDMFDIMWKNEQLIAIQIDRRYYEDNKRIFDDIRLYRHDTDGSIFILVKANQVFEFNDPPRYINGTGIIVLKSIKIKENYESKLFKIGDVVTYDNGNERLYGRIDRFELLNNVPCLGLMNSIEIAGTDSVVYIREGWESVKIMNAFETEYVDDTIIIPRSIVTFKQSSDEELRDGDIVEFTLKNIRRNYQGKVHFIAEVNGEICAVVEFSYDIDNIDVKSCFINNKEPFKKICKSANHVVIVKGSPTTRKKYLQCEINNLCILNPENIDMIDGYETDDKIITFKSRGRIMVARLHCHGLINNEIIIGCTLKQETIYGTNGLFGGQKLFDCADGRGVLILLDRIKECCVKAKHKMLDTTEDGRVVGTSLCCAKVSEHLRDKFDIKLGVEVVKIKNVGFIRGMCRWIGYLNDKETIGVESKQDHKQEWQDESIDQLGLFENPMHKIALFVPDEFYQVDVNNFYKNIFYKNEVEDNSIIRSADVGKLVCVRGHRGTYGRILHRTLCNKHLLSAIEIDADYLRDHEDIFRHIKVHKNKSGDNRVVMALSRYVHEFKEPIRYLRGGFIVDKNSIIVKEHYVSMAIKVDDIVSYENDGEKCYGRIVGFALLHDVRCVRVVNSIDVSGNKEEIYIREDKVKEVKIDQSLTKYIDDTIIDPQSIVTCKKSITQDLAINDEVEFTLKESKKIYQGSIRLIADINRELCAFVELFPCQIDETLDKYKVNDILDYQNLNRFTNVTVIVKGPPTIRKKFLTCINPKVTILNPVNVDVVEESKDENKIITFKSNGVAIVARLLWHGRINNEIFIGCELKQETIYGTNGTFGDRKLFECPEGRGVLIPLDKIENCCVNGTHMKLCTSRYGQIVGSSICCAKNIGQLGNRVDINLYDRVKIFDIRGKIYGTCRWLGLVNNEDVIGVDMSMCYDKADDELMNQVVSFEFTEKTIVLFNPDEFCPDSAGLKYCFKNGIRYIDPRNIKSIEDREIVSKQVKYKTDAETDAIINIRWRGKVNGESCVGCEMRFKCTCGMDGFLENDELFQCIPSRGFLIPVTGLHESCENSRYLIEIGQLIADERYKCHKVITCNGFGSIDIDSICCVERKVVLDSQQTMAIGSKLKYRDNFVCDKELGNCKWKGLVNGVESIGLNMKVNVNNQRAGEFSGFEIFPCKAGRGVIMTTEAVEHDIEGEKLPFLMGNIVKVDKLWKVKKIGDTDTQGKNIGDYVGKYLDIEENGKLWNGELKWIGVINNVVCVGIDLEDECAYGLDGVIDARLTFDYLPRHGIVTTLDNLIKHDELNTVSFTVDGMIDAEKFIKSEEIWNEELLREKKVERNGEMFVITTINGTKKKRKGTLKWSGTMNKVLVVVVELAQNYEGGTNGRFWRRRIIECANQRAVAVSWDNVYEYIPYESLEIPEDDRLFKDLSINSAVVVYLPQRDTIKDFFGTLKWTGVDEYGEYYYGIELDDRHSTGTNGTFNGQVLFRCQNYFGILMPMDNVAPDVRFVMADELSDAEKSSLQAKTTFFKFTVIDPRSLLAMKVQYSDEWIIGSMVEFSTNDSLANYCGTLQWTGFVNAIISAVVKVDSIEPNDPIRDYFCPKDILRQIKLSSDDNMVVVLLATLKKTQDRSYLNRIFEYINDKEYGCDILMEIVNNEDTRALRDIIKVWRHPIDLTLYPQLLTKLIGQLNYDVISILLDKFVTSDNDNLSILNVAKYFLLKEDYPAFSIASRKCQNVNIILNNGDTFLTDIMKLIDDENIINVVIESKIFEVNIPNIDGDNPLVIGCRKLLISTVRLLINNGANVSYHNNMAIDVVKTLRRNNTDPERLAALCEIMEILMDGIKIESEKSNVKECSICLDRPVNTSFNCGHTACQICSTEINTCHMCKQVISKRKRIYFS